MFRRPISLCGAAFHSQTLALVYIIIASNYYYHLIILACIAVSLGEMRGRHAGIKNLQAHHFYDAPQHECGSGEPILIYAKSIKTHRQTAPAINFAGLQAF